MSWLIPFRCWACLIRGRNDFCGNRRRSCRSVWCTMVDPRCRSHRIVSIELERVMRLTIQCSSVSLAPLLPIPASVEIRSMTKKLMSVSCLDIRFQQSSATAKPRTHKIKAIPKIQTTKTPEPKKTKTENHLKALMSAAISWFTPAKTIMHLPITDTSSTPRTFIISSLDPTAAKKEMRSRRTQWCRPT